VSLHSTRTIAELRQHNQRELSSGSGDANSQQDQLTYLNGKEEL